MSARWGAITAGEIASIVGGTLLSSSPETVFASLGTDSRQVRRGQLFWALLGERFDGHDFAAEAIRSGASGVVIQESRKNIASSLNTASVIAVEDTLKSLGDLASWWRRRHRAQVAAITGSMGKTTTKEMTAAILSTGRSTLSNRGNFNNLIGLPLSLFQLREEHRALVVEMGMNRRGEIARLTEIADPDVGLITNVGRVHLEGLGDIAGVARAKAELLEKMAPAAVAMLNGDDELLMKTASAFRPDSLTFGLGPRNDFQGRDVRDLGREGTLFDLCHGGHKTTVRLTIPGRHHVMNALAASAIALSLGESEEHIAAALAGYHGVKGRFTVTTLASGALLVDDTYNSNPTSLKAALGNLKSLLPGGGRIMVGLGDMLELGAESEMAHLEAGAMIAGLGAALFAAMGNFAERMIQGAVESGLSRDKTAKAGTHGEMVRIFQNELKAGDLLFLKGSRRIGLDQVARALRDEGIEGGAQ